MKTVIQLISELEQFPLDAYCYAYVNEIEGILVIDKKDIMKSEGFIFLSEDQKNEETILFK